MKFFETKTVVAMWEDRTMKTIQEKQIIVRTWRMLFVWNNFLVFQQKDLLWLVPIFSIIDDRTDP